MTRVLVVDDERYLADLVATALSYEGYETAVAGSCQEATERIREFAPELIVLDIVLPDGSGVDLCAKMRREGDTTPVVFLTARDAPEDKIAGLTVGADDYVGKPFSLEELILRVRTILRRVNPQRHDASLLSLADLEIDADAYVVRRQDQIIDLTPTEFRLLWYLVSNAGHVLTKRQIFAYVWEYDFGGNDSVLQTYISYLRSKVDVAGPKLIHTIPRIGYVARVSRAGSDVAS